MIGWVLYLIRYGDQSGRRWLDQAIAISADSSGTLHKPQRQKHWECENLGNLHEEESG